MAGIKRSPRDFSLAELDRELIARGARTPAEERYRFSDPEGTPSRDRIMAQTRTLYRPGQAPCLNHALSHLSTRQLAEAVILKIREEENNRAIRGGGMRLDMYEINDTDIKRNARSVASIWMKENIIDNGCGSSSLQLKIYGESFNLHRGEPYHKQPIAAGRLCTGFLVKNNVIATAGHCADEQNVKHLRFVFGYQMEDADQPVTHVPNEEVYNGMEIIARVYDPGGTGTDWALVKLDRCVTGRDILKLAETGVRRDDPVYVLGHPCGLPLKYVPDEPITEISRAVFSAELSVYGGNSGSPVFNSITHDVVGIVVRGDNQNFRWTGSGWISIRYPHNELRSAAPQCTRVSEFIDFCK